MTTLKFFKKSYAGVLLYRCGWEIPDSVVTWHQFTHGVKAEMQRQGPEFLERLLDSAESYEEKLTVQAILFASDCAHEADNMADGRFWKDADFGGLENRMIVATALLRRDG